MERRLLGATVLTLTLLTAVAVSRLVGVGVAGTAVAAPPDPPPVVGACLLQDPQTQQDGFGELTIVSYGSCGGPHFGEVVSVTADSSTFPRNRLDSMTSPDPAACDLPASAYLGVDLVLPGNDRGDLLTASFGSWEPAPTGSVAVIGPDARQRAVGQRWAACVTQPTTDRPFVGSVRAAFGGGALPDEYALCGDALLIRSGGMGATDCSIPHRAELFARTSVTFQLAPEAELQASCRQFVAHVTRMPDPTGGGQLLVVAQTVVFDVGGHPHLGHPDGSGLELAQSFCGVQTVGATRLTGTLFALGTLPLPVK